MMKFGVTMAMHHRLGRRAQEQSAITNKAIDENCLY